MQEKIGVLRQQFKTELSTVKDTKDVEQLKIRFLGKKGPVQDLMNALRESPSDQRPLLGKQINDLKTELSQLCDQALGSFHEAELASRIADEKIDVTLPGRRRFMGRKHPLTALLDEIIEILSGMGFSVQYGPDIDSDWYNYEGLNFPPDHPAREMQDTFYIDAKMLLRSHDPPQSAPTGEGFAIFQVTGIVPAHAPAFADWKSHVLDDYRQEQLPCS